MIRAGAHGPLHFNLESSRLDAVDLYALRQPWSWQCALERDGCHRGAPRRPRPLSGDRSWRAAPPRARLAKRARLLRPEHVKQVEGHPGGIGGECGVNEGVSGGVSGGGRRGGIREK